MDERLDKVKVQCDYLPLINFAIQQNGASIIHQLSIENTTPAPLKDIQVQITTEPTFGNAAPIAVEQIPANDSIRLSSFNLTLSANYFTQLTERLSGNLKIEITAEAEPIFCQTYPIDIRPMGRTQRIARNAGCFHHSQSYSYLADYQKSCFHPGAMDRQPVPR